MEVHVVRIFCNILIGGQKKIGLAFLHSFELQKFFQDIFPLSSPRISIGPSQLSLFTFLETDWFYIYSEHKNT